MMELIETSVFTMQARLTFSVNEYRALQEHLQCHPSIGEVILRSGGLRKLSWRSGHDAKRKRRRDRVGVIYYWEESGYRLHLLLTYSNKGCTDPSHSQLRKIRRLIHDE